MMAGLENIDIESAGRCGIGVALTLTLIVAMVVADVLTKGYFRWRLRLLASLAIGLIWSVVVLLPEWI